MSPADGGLAPRRLRQVRQLSSDAGGPALLYDLERTFVLEVPAALQGDVAAVMAGAAGSPAAQTWLLDEDLLTTDAPVSRSEGPEPRLPQVTDISLDMSGACNMGCAYCFEHDIGSRTGAMSDETATAALDFAFAQSRGAPQLALHFGSGEPLIRFALLQRLVLEAEARAEAAGTSVKFELTTNATLVSDEIAAFLAAHPFNVRVSCDGPAELHNGQRPMLGGRPSYPMVLRGLRRLLRTMADRVTVNSVICGGTRLAEVWRWAKDLGLRRLHVIKVGAFEGDLNLRRRELADYRADLEAIAAEMRDELAAGRTPIDFQPITKIIRRLMIPEPITRFCGVAGSYLGVSSQGEVYPCFRHLGLEAYHLGDIRSGVDGGKRQAFMGAQAADVDTRPDCQSCWARYLCGGGCYADSTVYGADPLRPQVQHCPFWRTEIDVAIRLFDRLRRGDPSALLRLFGDDPEDIFDASGAPTPTFLERRNCL